MVDFDAGDIFTSSDGTSHHSSHHSSQNSSQNSLPSDSAPKPSHDHNPEINDNIHDESLPDIPPILLNYGYSSRSISASKSIDTPNCSPCPSHYETPIANDDNMEHQLETIDEKAHNKDLYQVTTMNFTFYQLQSEGQVINNDNNDNVNEDTKDNENDDKYIKILSNNGWNKGIHEWSIKLSECAVSRLEVGVVSVNDESIVHMNNDSIKGSQYFGARAVYGCETQLKTNDSYMYYASYNSRQNNHEYERCFKVLSKVDSLKWNDGDVIRVLINLNKWKIKFYLNDEQVRKDLSLEINHMYYPIIAYCGHCEYKLMGLT